MEEPAHHKATLGLLTELVASPWNVGVVIQASLHSSPRDVEDLIARGAMVRLCKGAFVEPAGAAYPHKEDGDRAFSGMDMDAHLPRQPPGDRHARRAADRLRIRLRQPAGDRRRQARFQMLCGVRRDLQDLPENGAQRPSVRAYRPGAAPVSQSPARREASRPVVRAACSRAVWSSLTAWAPISPLQYPSQPFFLREAWACASITSDRLSGDLIVTPRDSSSLELKEAKGRGDGFRIGDREAARANLGLAGRVLGR